MPANVIVLSRPVRGVRSASLLLRGNSLFRRFGSEGLIHADHVLRSDRYQTPLPLAAVSPAEIDELLKDPSRVRGLIVDSIPELLASHRGGRAPIREHHKDERQHNQ